MKAGTLSAGNPIEMQASRLCGPEDLLSCLGPGGSLDSAEQLRLVGPEQELNGISIDEINRVISILFTHGNSHLHFCFYGYT